eukprot:11707557-Karenia_brevis.AAC.1
MSKPMPRLGGYAAGWSHLKLDIISQALASYTLASLVIVAGVVFRLSGLMIGGVASGACLSIVIAVREQLGHVESPGHTLNFHNQKSTKCISEAKY